MGCRKLHVNDYFRMTDSASGTDVPYYALADANKNITEYFDSNGNVVAHYEYSPFGKITKKSGTMQNDFDYRFSSEVFDTETGLSYYNYRYYSPELGRWLSRDLIQEIAFQMIQKKENRNIFEALYGMVGNNPIGKWDAFGLITCYEKTARLAWLSAQANIKAIAQSIIFFQLIGLAEAEKALQMAQAPWGVALNRAKSNLKICLKQRENAKIKFPNMECCWNDCEKFREELVNIQIAYDSISAQIDVIHDQMADASVNYTNLEFEIELLKNEYDVLYSTPCTWW